MPDETENPEPYLVWSNEHRAWWAPGSGYTASVAAARPFTRSQALQIALHAMPGQAARSGMIPDLPVRLADIEAIRCLYRDTYPNIGPEAWE